MGPAVTWAILPVKDLVRAKSRLAGVLAPHERRALAQAMVEDVLVALTGCGELQGVLMVSDEEDAGEEPMKTAMAKLAALAEAEAAVQQ